ncbi:RHS repeat domain-containing protein [Capnocytophaga sp. oral taxon 878]|uniref:RHS repeat domain-containing protein n=1 Tax=Capnocytophaga sp. oral taxon 878 TaxID=1316596 RepID=UPI0013ED3698|nr:RHS repeat-associated core domain-containing protein [Capnocytophaga sp. oral taxon 878]
MPLHEWKETFELNYSTGLYDLGTEHSPTTWIFEAGSFVPCGKITNGKHYSIITDHLGTPIEAYNQEGELIWEREQDLYGNSRQGFAKENFRCPFKYQGQYYDPEIELCYNRFRYYHPETGRYISEDPIGFLSGEPNFFAYVSDTNAWLDVLGLVAPNNNGISAQHGNSAHNAFIDDIVKDLKSDPTVDQSSVRKNQEQVDFNGNKVGSNRPDLQYNDIFGNHYNIEVDTTDNGRLNHSSVIPVNDPNARNTFWLIDMNGNVRQDSSGHGSYSKI